MTDVEDPESYFGMHSMTDQTNTRKPVVYMSPKELYHLHYTLQQNIDMIEPEGSGVLHDIVDQIGPSPYHPDLELPESMVCLTLTYRCDNIPMDPNARLQQILVDTKRLVVYVIKIQSGKDLEQILRDPVMEEHEAMWTELKKTEFSESNEDSTVTFKRRHLYLSQCEQPLDLKR